MWAVNLVPCYLVCHAGCILPTKLLVESKIMVVVIMVMAFDETKEMFKLINQILKMSDY